MENILNLKTNFDLSDANRVVINKHLNKIKKYANLDDLSIQIYFEKNTFEVSYRLDHTFVCQRDNQFGKAINKATKIFIEKLKSSDKKKLTKIIKSKKSSKTELNLINDASYDED